MTRLQSDDIAGITPQLKAYDEDLIAKTGHNLGQIASHAAGLTEITRAEMAAIRVVVVPISWGQGVIEGFGEATAGILKHVGFDACVTGHTDIAGLTEACETKADIIFLSDDNDFAALNTRNRQYVHNAEATGKGFAAGLDLMTGGLAQQPVLVLGCGAVGRSASLSLLHYGATVSIYDIDSRYPREFISTLSGFDPGRVTVAPDFNNALAGHSLIVDATNAAEIIRAEDISPQTFIVAPGMPMGLSDGALNKVTDRLLHDPLQIGVATMAMAVAKQIMEIR